MATKPKSISEEVWQEQKDRKVRYTGDISFAKSGVKEAIASLEWRYFESDYNYRHLLPDEKAKVEKALKLLREVKESLEDFYDRRYN